MIKPHSLNDFTYDNYICDKKNVQVLKRIIVTSTVQKVNLKHLELQREDSRSWHIPPR